MLIAVLRLDRDIYGRGKVITEFDDKRLKNFSFPEAQFLWKNKLLRAARIFNKTLIFNFISN